MRARSQRSGRLTALRGVPGAIALLAALALPLALPRAASAASGATAPPAAPQPAAPAADPFERWLEGTGPPAWPAGLEALRERLGAKTARIEGSFHHDPDVGLRFDFAFAVRRAPGAADEAVAAARAFGRERAAQGGPRGVREEVEAERVVLDGSADHEVRVHYLHIRPGAPGVDSVAALAARWPGLATPAAVPEFLREALGPLRGLGCDGVPVGCRYWTFTPAEAGDLVARARAIMAAARRHGFAYDVPPTADPTDSSVTGFQDCSGAALATRFWGDRLHVTLQMSGAGGGTRPVAECSRAAGARP